MQLTMVTLLAAGMAWRALHWAAGPMPFTMFWALVFILAHGILLRLIFDDLVGVGVPLRERPGEVS